MISHRNAPAPRATREPTSPQDRAWTEPRVELLRELISGGLSCSQIAAEICRRLPGRPLSRNAVIGKADRMGMTRPAQASAPSKLRAPSVARDVRQNAGLAFKTRKFGAAEANPEVVAPFADVKANAFAPLSGSTPKVWTERLSGMCAWPVGGEGADTLSCCEPSIGSWCVRHMKRGHAPASAKAWVDKRNAPAFKAAMA